MTEWLQNLLAHDGYTAIFIVLFLNNLGIPLPGTTMLLAAGYLVGTGNLTWWGTAAIAVAACFLGTGSGYAIGRRYGAPLLEKIKWLRVSHQRLLHMQHFFKRYGAKGVFFARFVSILHPVIGLLSGIGKTPLKPFLFYNFIGSAVYVALYILAGKFLGQRWGFHHVWQLHVVLCVVIVAAMILGLSVYWSHSIYTLFGHPIYKKKRRGFWGKRSK
jgi:membrane protein DedA with SNARE-associated domain